MLQRGPLSGARARSHVATVSRPAALHSLLPACACRRRGAARRERGREATRCAATSFNPLGNYTRASLAMYAHEEGKLVGELARPGPAVEATVQHLQEALFDKGVTQDGLLSQPLVAMQLVRLAEFVEESEWVRPLDAWQPLTAQPDPEELAKARAEENALMERHLMRVPPHAQFDSLLRHLLLQYDDEVPPALMNCFAPTYGLQPAQHWARAESPFLHTRTWLMTRRFARTVVGLGRGDSAFQCAKEHLSPALTKQMVKLLLATEPTVDSPAHALRRAQVAALGGSPALGRAACESTLGATLGDAAEEEFSQSMLQWVATREAELSKVNAAMVMNHLSVRYQTGVAKEKPFSMKGRTVSKVLRTASDIEEVFSPSGMQEMEWEDEAAESPSQCRVEVRELLSVAHMVQVGSAMENCLQSRRGVYKYSHRARNRGSSFWIVCYRGGSDGDASGKGADELECVLVFEVWNESRIVHQAEGPGSRFPSDSALRHMQTWSEANGVNWQTWEMW